MYLGITLYMYTMYIHYVWYLYYIYIHLSDPSIHLCMCVLCVYFVWILCMYLGIILFICVVYVYGLCTLCMVCILLYPFVHLLARLSMHVYFLCILYMTYRVYTESTHAWTDGQTDGQMDIIVYIPYTLHIHHIHIQHTYTVSYCIVYAHYE